MIYKKALIALIFFAFPANSSSTHVRHKKAKKGPATCAVVVVMNEKGELLLLRRKGTPFGEGLYALPGGKIESGETASEAAQREVQEEVGIIVEQLELVHVVDHQGRERECYTFFFKSRMWKGIVVNAEPHKCDQLGWFLPNNLPENIINGHRQAIELSLKGIAYSKHWQ